MSVWKPSLIEAKELADRNAKNARELTGAFASLQSRAGRVDSTYNAVLRQHFDGELVPFADLMGRIKNVDIEDLDLMAVAPEVRFLAPETRRVSIDAVKGLVSLAGGAAAGAGAGGVAFVAVGALATASTGTAIASLSGAAATSATLAWLGGGSLAAGGAGVAGGTMVLAGVVAVPVVLAAGGFLWWQGERALAQQMQTRVKLTAARSELDVQRRRVLAVDVATQRAARVLGRLGHQVTTLNQGLRTTLERTEDFRRFTAAEQRTLASHVALVVAMTAVMSAQPLTPQGEVSPDFRDVLGEAHDLLDAA